MKTQLRKLFWFVLRYFESGDEPYTYKPLNRKILLFVGTLFIALSLGTLYVSLGKGGFGFLVPVLVFFSLGVVCVIVGALGNDRAVSKIWGNR